MNLDQADIYKPSPRTQISLEFELEKHVATAPLRVQKHTILTFSPRNRQPK